MPVEHRWNILQPNLNTVDKLQAELGINKNLCKVLVNRNIVAFEQAKQYFRPSLAQTHSPWLMLNMQKAVNRVQAAITNNEKIMLYGDYDVDGTTSIALLFDFLTNICVPTNLSFYTPNRYTEGYGLSKRGIDEAIKQGISLLITLDCGIKSNELIKYAQQNGVDVIVCDHHLPDTELPQAFAILNPKQKNCTYPFRDLCGCGIAFKLAEALAEEYRVESEILYQNIDLLALAIGADIVPMVDENRIYTYIGLQKANLMPNLGIQALKDVAEFKAPLRLSDLVFVIAPRINAAGRIEDAAAAVKLFLSKTNEEVRAFAEVLQNQNIERRALDRSIAEDALAELNTYSNEAAKYSTVVYNPNWHKGVLGIVASKLTDTYYRPTVVLTKDANGLLSGSARSVAGFDLYSALEKNSHFFTAFGGHFAAAGLTMEERHLPAFKSNFEEVVKNSLPTELRTPVLNIDAEITLAEITLNFADIVEQMQPYGPENMRPIFVARSIQDTGFSKVLHDKHIKFSIVQHDIKQTAIGFNLASKFSTVQNKNFDIAFTVEKKYWKDKWYAEIKVVDIQ